MYSLLSNAVIRMMSNDLKFNPRKIRKEEFFDIFRAFSLQFPGDAEENHELFENNRFPGRDSKLPPSW
jgi:hypothetical protein